MQGSCARTLSDPSSRPLGRRPAGAHTSRRPPPVALDAPHPGRMPAREIPAACRRAKESTTGPQVAYEPGAGLLAAAPVGPVEPVLPLQEPLPAGVRPHCSGSLGPEGMAASTGEAPLIARPTSVPDSATSMRRGPGNGSPHGRSPRRGRRCGPSPPPGTTWPARRSLRRRRSRASGAAAASTTPSRTPARATTFTGTGAQIQGGAWSDPPGGLDDVDPKAGVRHPSRGSRRRRARSRPWWRGRSR